MYLRYFAVAFVGYLVLALLTPIEHLAGDLDRAILFEAAFILIVMCSAAAVFHVCEFAFGPAATQAPERELPAIATWVVWICAAAAITGTLALIYDRIGVQGIDFSEGLAAAREQWRVLGEERAGGISSPYSAIGYLLSTSGFVGLGMVIAAPVQFSRRTQIFCAITTAISVLAVSVLSGGRSTVMLLLIFALAFYCLRRERGGSALRFTAMQVASLLLGVGLAVAYSVYIFSARADASNESPLIYAEGTLRHLGARPASWISGLDDSNVFVSIGILLLLAAAYIFHSLFTFGVIIESSDGYGTIIFSHILQLASRLGLVDPPNTDWFLTGLFPSLPGALFHQWGEVGVIAGAVVLGSATGLSRAFFLARPHSILALGLASSCYVTVLMAPLAFAPDVLSFPFIAFEFVMFEMLAVLLSRVAIGTRLHWGSLSGNQVLRS